MKNSRFCHLHTHGSHCLSGDTVIYHCVKHYLNCNNDFRKDYTRLKQCKTIKYLYEHFRKGKGSTFRYKVKVFDGDKFVPSQIKKIVKSKAKQLYKITTQSGKTIRCSAEHKFLSSKEWTRLKNLKVGDLIGCNGQLAYRNKNWLKRKYIDENLTQLEIAKMFDVSRSTIEDWIRKYSLNKLQSLIYANISRKKLGRREMLIKTSPKTISASRNRLRRNWYKYEKKKVCEKCSDLRELYIHHVDQNPLNNNLDNLQSLCKSCHRKEHSPMPWTVKYEKITSIEKDKFEETYDLEVVHSAHNFVANGIVTHNSYLDGLGTVKQLTTRAKELGFTHLAYTNHGNIDGLIQFQKACDDIGLNPVLGCEMYIVPKILEKNKDEKRGHIILLVKNQSGWKDLCRMLTKANIDGFYYKPRIDYDMLLSCDLSGLVILTACIKSFVYLPMGEALLWDLAEQTKDVYIEIMPHRQLEGIKEHNERMSLLKMKYGLKFVATNDVHYIRKEDYKTHEVLLAMQTKAKMSDSKRWKFDERGLYLRTANEMIRAFSTQGFFDRDTVISALKNTIKIAEKCESFRIPKYSISLPAILKKNNDDDYLSKLCEESPLLKKKKKYLKRMKMELKIIKEKKFSRYFLIVRDLVRWCKNNDILVGCGRGSVGGSLCAYLIEITTIDPIRYGLLFSRFINKERIDFPDIDLDFEHNKRGLVINYLKKKYGEKQVAGVSTFLTMQGKTVVRDVARVFDVPLKDVNEFTKAIFVDSESESSLSDSLSTFEGKCFQKKYPDVIEHALKLEGQEKSCGQHAAAVVVSPVNLYASDRGNLCVRGNSENKSLVINWEMSDADYVGLMKLDILGLNTLTILNEAKRLTGKVIDFTKIKPLNKEVFAEMSRGETVGIFQMSTPIMTETIKRMGISNFNDMAASLALVRPGPLESKMAENYILRKNGQKWEKKHPVYEKITKDTYGVVIYQEQVMQVINKVAGLSYSVADEIRKVIGKKRHSSEFEPYRKKFLEGCEKTKIFSGKEAQWFWDMILKCARYLFNKSHAVEYAMLAYWTAYFKHKYPKEFITACLTYGSEKKKDEYIREAKRMGIAIMSPKIGLSDNLKWKIVDDFIYAPFIEIKGMGEKSVKKINQFQKSNMGFFSSDQQAKGRVGELLNAIGAFSPNAVVPDIGKYFSFNIGSSVSLKKIPFKGYSNKEKLSECKSCALRKECSRPVMPCAGRYNVAIIGEAPGGQEEQEGIPFIGKAGKLLFDAIRKYGAERHWFHITNICKCYPSKTKTPEREHINACSAWLKDELESIQCGLILSLGATSLYALTGQEGGIMNVNGKLEYNNKTKCMVMYCIHPAAVLRDPNKAEMFNSTIKSFVSFMKGGM